MIYKEIFSDLFLMKDEYYLVHCISADYKLGKGIALEFNKRYNMRNRLLKSGKVCTGPDCVLIENVFNLVTKEFFYLKPTYKTLKISLEKMKQIVIEKNVKKIAMPMIACGLDRLEWQKVKVIIQEIYNDLDVEIVVCLI